MEWLISIPIFTQTMPETLSFSNDYEANLEYIEVKVF